jgi:hypothetical protein
MIENVSEAIIAASPDFGEAWERFKASEMYGPGEPYNHLGELARHLVTSFKAGKVDGFQPVFGEVERQLAIPSPGVRDLIIVGFLEDLQNLSLNGNVAPSAWKPWLGKKTSEAWKVLEDFWLGRLPQGQLNSYVRGQET